MRPVARVVRPLAVLAAIAAFAPSASAQCPAGSYTCYFGTDVGGSSITAPPSMVNSTNAQTDFLNRLIGTGTEDFESFTPGTTTPINLTFPGAGTATLSGGGSVSNYPGVGAGRYATSGTQFYEALSAENGATTFTIDFTDPVAAFGFFASDIGDFNSQLSLRFTLVGGTTIDWALPYVASNGTNTDRDGSLLYAGFIAESGGFTKVEFIGTDVEDYFGFDDMTIGSLEQVVPPTITPEPASLVLMATGLVGIFGAARRRKTRLAA